MILLTTNLRAIIGELSEGNQPYNASPNAARFLLMKVLLNKQAFLNKQTPGAQDQGDMNEIISLGTSILQSNSKNSVTGAYFHLHLTTLIILGQTMVALIRVMDME